MARISVTDPHGRNGTIEDTDATGETFRADFLSDVPGLVTQGVQQLRGTVGPLPSVPEDLAQRFLAKTPLGQSVSAHLTAPPQSPVGKGMAAGISAAPWLVGFADPGAISPFLRKVPSIVDAARMGGAVADAAVSPARGMWRVFTPGALTELAGRTRQGFEEVVQGSKQAWEPQMQQFTGTHDLSDVLAPLIKLMGPAGQSEAGAAAHEALQPALQYAEQAHGDTILRDVLENPELAKALTTDQAHRILTTLKQTPEAAAFFTRMANAEGQLSGAEVVKRMGGGSYQPLFNQVGEGIGERLTAAYPQTPAMRFPARESYAGAKELYGQIQGGATRFGGQFNDVGNTLEKGIKKGFGGGEQAKQIFQLLPERTARQVQDYKNARNLVTAAGSLFALGKGLTFLKKIAEPAPTYFGPGE